jgi:hypothetical protein
MSGITNGLTTGDFSGLVNPILSSGIPLASVGLPSGLAGGAASATYGDDAMADMKNRAGDSNLTSDFARQLGLDSLTNDANVQRLVANDRGGLYRQYADQTYQKYGGQGTGTSYTNIDDYIKSGQDAITSAAGKEGANYNASAGNSANAVATARQRSRDELTSALDKIINTTGVKNQLNINQDDSKNETLQRAKRFGRLV